MADWSQVQAKNSQSPAGNTLILTFTSVVSSGSIVVGGVLLNTGFVLSTVTDDKLNAYTVFDSHDDGSLYVAGFHSNSTITNGPATLTYTATGTGTTANFWVAQNEFTPPTGSTGVITVDGSSTTSASGGTSFTNFSTSDSDDLVYAVSFSSGSSTHGSSFNAGAGDGTAVCSEWGIQSSAGTVTMTLATQTGSFWGPSFGINAGGGAAPTFVPFQTYFQQVIAT